MECMVCSGNMSYNFSKQMEQYNLTTVEYWRCKDCGFVASINHFEMSEDEKTALNNAYHESYLCSDSNHDDPNWLKRLSLQVEVIEDIARLGYISTKLPWIDFGCGDGKLAKMLSEHGFDTYMFDKYMPSAQGWLSESDVRAMKFGLVVNTSVFEHVTRIEYLDGIAALVDESGVLAIHTLVREDVPEDPDWFYLLPVHCSFYSNRSMQILFDSWGFSCSLYQVDARMWFWFIRSRLLNYLHA
jgi:2-polyprenyl-3-methyl-5-hydroxy-6-metoxy-1,4-benzoquinol methylase